MQQKPVRKEVCYEVRFISLLKRKAASPASVSGILIYVEKYLILGISRWIITYICVVKLRE